eukprot:5360015-Pyramimonas_sp.AAC.1
MREAVRGGPGPKERAGWAGKGSPWSEVPPLWEALLVPSCNLCGHLSSPPKEPRRRAPLRLP